MCPRRERRQQWRDRTYIYQYYSLYPSQASYVPDLVAIKVVGEDLLGGAVEDTIVFGGDLDGNATSLLVEVKLLAPGLA